MPSTGAEPSPERVEEIFQQAFDLMPEARAAFLSEACAGDEALRAMAENLLRSASEMEHNPDWRTPAMIHEAQASALTTTPVLDRYRLTGKLGTGGMGVVYRAERSDGAYQKQVAIKIVPWAAGDEKLLDRFREERAILARLDHPNIARLLDGGTTADGLPYIAMELAEGVPIDEFAKREKPSQRELVELFRRICAAVSYAHRNLIVHRDLKPGNILVSRGTDGVADPKLLDFGIAKLLDESDLTTRTRALTPEYASPEQISGAPVTTASDVYSLGVLLYELVSGHRPYRATTGVMDLAAAICNDEPVTPGPEFDPDIANIVLMALRKEPDRRYASAEQMSDDLRRWLEGYPVTARPDTRGYRARKFLFRNKLAAAAAAGFLLAIGGGAVTTLRQANIANRRFNDVRKLANSYLFEFHDAIIDLPGSTAARQLVVKRGMEYLDGMSREHSGDRTLTRELAAAYTRIGDVQGRVDTPNLGDSQGALDSYAKAARLYEEVLATGRDSEAALGSADDHAKSGRILQMKGDVRAAEARQKKAISLVEAYAPVSQAARDILPGHYAVLAGIEGNPASPNLGHTEQALELYRKALRGYQDQVRAHPGDSDLQQRLSVRYNQMGQMQQALDNGPAAVEAFRNSVDINEKLLRENPNNSTSQHNVAVTSNNIATVYNQVMNKPQEAQPYSDRALKLFRALVSADPKDVQSRINLADGLYTAGRTADFLHDRRHALALFDESVELFESIIRLTPGSPPPTSRTAWQFRADMFLDSGNLPAAMADIRRELAIDDQILRANNTDASSQRSQAIAWAQTGRVHLTLAKRASRVSSTAEWREALSWYEKAGALYLDQQKRGTFIPLYRGALELVRKQIEICRKALAI